VICYLTPAAASSIYIGELDQNAQRVFMPLLQRGLIRLEGYVQRIHPEAVSILYSNSITDAVQHQYQASIFVLVFTLPSNIMFIANHLASNHCYLVDPMPDYDPSRHNDSRYDNAHKDYYIPPQNNGAYGSGPNPWAGPMGMILGPTKTNQVEVQREQVDEVFKSLKDDMKLAESEPGESSVLLWRQTNETGPFIKTKLFTHQKQALTFLREQEKESSAIETAMNALVEQARKLELEQEMAEQEVEVVDKDGHPEPKESTIPKYRKRDRSKEDWTGRSLWETHKDESGKITGYKNRITGESRKAKKDEDRPEEARGAILADDVSTKLPFCADGFRWVSVKRSLSFHSSLRHWSPPATSHLAR
jgi:SWI/SNF-related matrix-associated actin-dependent regulator of chromatin subfamily A3